jgi:hypothetical protein
MQKTPGGDTGLLVKTLKSIGAGENAQVVAEYAVDTALLAEIRKHEDHVAVDLGQRNVDYGPGDNIGVAVIAQSLTINHVSLSIDRESAIAGNSGTDNRNSAPIIDGSIELLDAGAELD